MTSPDEARKTPFRPGLMLVRGASRRCARCGSGRLFRGYFRLNATQNSGGSSSAPYIAIGLALAVVVPIVFYPFSKTIWTAIDLIMHHGDTT